MVPNIFPACHWPFGIVYELVEFFMWPNICPSVLPLLSDFLLPSSANSGVSAPVSPIVHAECGLVCVAFITRPSRGVSVSGVCWRGTGLAPPEEAGSWLVDSATASAEGCAGSLGPQACPVSPALAVSAPCFCHCCRLRLRFRAPEGKVPPRMLFTFPGFCSVHYYYFSCSSDKSVMFKSPTKAS